MYFYFCTKSSCDLGQTKGILLFPYLQIGGVTEMIPVFLSSSKSRNILQ